MKALPKYKLVESVVILLLLLFYFIMVFFGRGEFWRDFEETNLIIVLAALPLSFLINNYLLIPFFAKNKRWFIYILSLTILLIIFELLRLYFTELTNPQFFGRGNILFTFIIGVILSWLYTGIRDWIINLSLIEKLKSEKIQSELDLLKTQVDPHFLFNSLNSIYSLAIEEDSPKTAESIIQLSSLMRYNLHESSQKRISLEKEIEYIEKYISLQKLRLNESNRVEFSTIIEERELRQNQIAPLLLIPIIENVFKHGISSSKSTFSEIRIECTKGVLRLSTKNDIVNKPASEKSNVGLKNLKERLNLLYPGKFNFTSEKRDETFHNYLKIDLR